MFISAIVLVKNEEKNLDRCLGSLNWVNEILLIDDYSTDKSLQISSKYRVQIIQRRLDNFSNQRNFALKRARGEWCFFVDADEEVSENLRDEIIKVCQNRKLNGCFLKRNDFNFGVWLKHGETAAVRLLRLGRKGRGWWEGEVDEVWKIEGKTSFLRIPLKHYPHPSISEFLTKINQRSSLVAETLYKQKNKVGLFDWFKPGAKFIQNYFFRQGFLDRIPGFLEAILMSFHSFLVRGKLFLLWKNKNNGTF